jgi:hypothetical protein
MSAFENSYAKDAGARMQQFLDRANHRDADRVAIPLDRPDECEAMIQAWWPAVLGVGERQLRAKLAGQISEEPEWDPAVLVAQMARAMGA